MSRLKAPPGYMSVYCNDGFTITAALVEAMSGKSYVQFVQDEILTPLGMANTRYPLSAFPAGIIRQGLREGRGEAAGVREYPRLGRALQHRRQYGSHRHDVPEWWKSRDDTYSFRRFGG
jgi:CubicO group peptidase (beta-lactamase class C family)